MNALRPDALVTAPPMTLETHADRTSGRHFWPYIQDPPTVARSTV